MKPLCLAQRSDRYRATTSEERDRVKDRSRNASNASRRRTHKFRRLHVNDSCSLEQAKAAAFLSEAEEEK